MLTPMSRPLPRLFVSILLGAALTACGGGGGSDSNSAASLAVVQDAGTASAGLDRFNYWRNELGLSVLKTQPQLTIAAQGHSDYQATNGLISHYQDPGTPGFTGECLGDSNTEARCAPAKVSRLEHAGYQLAPTYAFGEVISRTASTDGSAAADALIAAIYHRFVIFEPMFNEVGVGAARRGNGSTYFTTNFAVNGLAGAGLASTASVVYPFNGQTGVPRNFFSDQERPDPVASRNEVGYPISLHANISGSPVTVTQFTIRPQGGANMPVEQLWNAVDSDTPTSAAAIVPLDVLAPNTQYVVQFQGTVSGQAVNRTWSFTTGS